MDNQTKTENECNNVTLKDTIKIIITVTIALISLIFAILICFSIYNKGLIVESILSMLLAFFSIFISIFFYFKADETSNRFYDSSYKFMKEQSVLLGRIEERFGEKFENLFTRIDHLDVRELEKETELHGKTNEISDIVNEMISTISKYKPHEESNEFLEIIEKYGTELAEKKEEYNQLVENLQDVRHEVQETSNYFKTLERFLPNSVSEDMLSFFLELNGKELSYLLRCDGKIQSSNRAYRLARLYGFCNEKGQISSELKRVLDIVRHKNYY